MKSLRYESDEPVDEISFSRTKQKAIETTNITADTPKLIEKRDDND